MDEQSRWLPGRGRGVRPPAVPWRLEEFVAKPAIVAVDDDPQVAAAVARDLRGRYAAEYRIVTANSGAEALSALESLQSRGNTVALLLADQRMPEMEGTDFLGAARQLFPEAKRVLLTAYADTDAAIQAINEVELDYYLMKPWDPPEEKLYPILDDLIDDWKANVPAPFDGIRVLGTTWSPSTHETKDFLARNQIPYRFMDIERDSEAAAIVGEGSMPVVMFPDGSRLEQPDKAALAKNVGLRTEAEQPFYDLIVIGGGPAGLAGAVYGASEGLRTAMIERDAPGGQAGTSSRIENYLGFPNGISGGDLARRAATQAARLGAEILTAVEAVSIDVDDTVKIVKLSSGSELRSHAVLLASGMTVRRLAVPGYEKFEGAGVYYGAAPSESATYAGGHVFVIGGANSAGQAAMMFSRHVDQIAGQANIEVLVNTTVEEVIGGEQVEAVRLSDTSFDETIERQASALFIFVGAVPHSKVVKETVRMNDQGFVYTGPDIFLNGDRPESWNVDRDPYLMETSVPGIFAAGDVRHGVVRRVASAVGQGSVAISMIHQYLESV